MNSATPLQGHSILIVDDVPDLGFDLSTLLRRRGGAAAAEIVASIARAQARLRRAPYPTLAIIDHNIRDGYGITLALWIRQQTYLRDMYLVSYSAQLDEHILATASENPFDHMITKGTLSVESLIAQIGKVISDKNAESQEARQ